jgi:hypothetical protein
MARHRSRIPTEPWRSADDGRQTGGQSPVRRRWRNRVNRINSSGVNSCTASNLLGETYHHSRNLTRTHHFRTIDKKGAADLFAFPNGRPADGGRARAAPTPVPGRPPIPTARAPQGVPPPWARPPRAGARGRVPPAPRRPPYRPVRPALVDDERAASASTLRRPAASDRVDPCRVVALWIECIGRRMAGRSCSAIGARRFDQPATPA